MSKMKNSKWWKGREPKTTIYDADGKEVSSSSSKESSPKIPTAPKRRGLARFTRADPEGLTKAEREVDNYVQAGYQPAEIANKLGKTENAVNLLRSGANAKRGITEKADKRSFFTRTDKDGLSRTERQVHDLIKNGHTTREIAKRFGVEKSTIEQISSAARRKIGTVNTPTTVSGDILTPQQQEIHDLKLEGYSNDEIAGIIQNRTGKRVSSKTIRNHVTNINKALKRAGKKPIPKNIGNTYTKESKYAARESKKSALDMNTGEESSLDNQGRRWGPE